ncbi:hypothetical protein AM352_24290 (plasmid) [Citrobacter koseri]|nr:hypothetical protein AM352_24290 [Citrobacter koseri]
MTFSWLCRTKRQRAIQGFSVEDQKRIKQRIVLSELFSDFEKGDTARRSRTTERSELVSEEAEVSRCKIENWTHSVQNFHALKKPPILEASF